MFILPRRVSDLTVWRYCHLKTHSIHSPSWWICIFYFPIKLVRYFFIRRYRKLATSDCWASSCLSVRHSAWNNSVPTREILLKSDKNNGHFTEDVCTFMISRGPGSSVGIATGYGLDGPETESRWGGGEIFRTCPDRPWGPPSLLYNGYWVFPGGKERPGRDADPSPPSSTVGHERVELYLYSPYEPYGLYRA